MVFEWPSFTKENCIFEIVACCLGAHLQSILKSKQRKFKSKSTREKDLERSKKRMDNFLKKKDEVQALNGMMAREAALDKYGVKHEFSYAEHVDIYNFSAHPVEAPIETIDASIPPPEITSYPEWPERKESTHCSGRASSDSAQAAGGARARRAKAIFEANSKK